MRATPSPDNVILGKGALYFDRRTAAGVSTGYRHLGNCSVFEVSTEDDVLELRSSLSSAAGVYKRVTRQRSVKLSITGYEFEPNLLAIALMGDVTDFIQAGGSITAETLATAEVTGLAGKYFQTANRKISAVTLKQGAATLVEGTDYEVVNATVGIIRILPTSETVADGTALTIDYTAAAVAAGATKLIRGATTSLVQGKLLFVGDPQTGPAYEATVWNASFSPQGALGLLQDDWGTWQLDGTAQDDSAGQYGGSTLNPYYQLVESN